MLYAKRNFWSAKTGKHLLKILILTAAFLLVPVFFMTNTYTLSRRVALYSGGIATEGKEALFAKLNGFLFGGAAGENIDAALKDLSFSNLYTLWALLPCMLVAVIAGIQLRFGAIKHTLLRPIIKI